MKLNINAIYQKDFWKLTSEITNGKINSEEQYKKIVKAKEDIEAEKKRKRERGI